jgi:hypothetical protein
VKHGCLGSSRFFGEFEDGAPSEKTVTSVDDYLDRMHGVKAVVNAYQGASTLDQFASTLASAIRGATIEILA